MMIMMIVKRLQNQMLEHNGIVNKFIILVCLLSWLSLVSAADSPSCTQMGTIVWFLMLHYVYILLPCLCWWHTVSDTSGIAKQWVFCAKIISFILTYHNAVVTAIMHSIEENLCSWHGVLLFYTFFSPHYFSFLKQVLQNVYSSSGDFFFLERMEIAFLSLPCSRCICIFLLLCAL